MKMLAVTFLFLFSLSIASAQSPVWQQTNGPFNRVVVNSVHALRYGPNGSLFAGNNTGIYRSRDRGVTWELVCPTRNQVTSITYDSSSQRLYATSIISGVAPPTNESGLLQSTDGGDNWTIVQGQGFHPSDAYAVLVAPNGYIFLASEGLWRSTDKGLTWEWKMQGLGDTYLTALNSNLMTGDIYAAAWIRGVYRSTDHGGQWQTWTDIGLVGPESYCLAIDTAGTLWAGGSMPGATLQDLGTLVGYTVWRSSDRGVSWTAGARISRTSVIWAIVIDRENRPVVATRGGLYRTSDQGASWQRLGDSLAAEGRALLNDGNGGYYLGTDTLGLFHMVPPEAGGDGHWEHLSLELPRTYASINDISVDTAAGVVVARAFDGSRYATTDRGANWVLKDVFPLRYNVSPWGDIYSVSDTCLKRSTDGGITWNVLLSWGSSGNFGYELAFKSPGLVLLNGGQNVIHRSSDRGLTWETITVYMPATMYESMDFSNFLVTQRGSILMDFHEARPPTEYPPSNPRYGIKRSTDDGRTWLESTIHLLPSQETPYVLKHGVAPELHSATMLPDGQLFAPLTGMGILRSRDDGATWDAVCDAATNGSLFFNGLRLFVTILYAPAFPAAWQPTAPALSVDSCRTWVRLTSGIDTSSLSLMTSAAFDKDGYLYLGTAVFSPDLSSSGVYRTSISLSNWFPDTVTPPDAIPSAYALEQNYPNPFNPLTMIKYTVGGTGDGGRGASVKLAVYDLLGREVTVLVNERKAPGRYEANFEGSGLPSGVYFYRMEAGSFTQTKKMLLLK